MTETAIAKAPPEKPNVQQLLARVNDLTLSQAARINSVGDVMKAMQSKMMAALPKHITADRMIRVALNCIRKNPKLLECDPASLFGCITEAATYGWELGGILGHAYLAPFNKECTLIPGYKGLIDLCRRSGQISTISLEVVHEGDKFDYSIGDDPRIYHKPDDKNPNRQSKPITYVYAVVRMRDGGVQRSVWSSQQIENHKEKYSNVWQYAERNGKKDSPWHTAWSTMAKKTVIRDMINRGLIPVSAEYRDIIHRADRSDEGEMEMDDFDILPEQEELAAIEGEVADTHDRPKTGDQPDQDVIDLARMDFAAASDAEGVMFARDEFLKRDINEATRTAIVGMATERLEAMKPVKKQKHLGQ